LLVELVFEVFQRECEVQNFDVVDRSRRYAGLVFWDYRLGPSGHGECGHRSHAACSREQLPPGSLEGTDVLAVRVGGLHHEIHSWRGSGERIS
jgi:hypothetical protein